MSRILLAVVGTVAGLVTLLSFKTHPAVTGAHALPSAGLPGAATGTGAPASPSASAAPPDPSTGASSSKPSTSTSSAAAATRTIAGDPIDTQYGTVQVQVVVSGSRIVNVSFLQLTAFDPRSQEINDQAGPILLQETLAAQSAKIDTVSGASYTSEGYLESLQSALDKAGIK